MLSGRGDLNSRPSDPQSDALTKLRHGPIYLRKRAKEPSHTALTADNLSKTTDFRTLLPEREAASLTRSTGPSVGNIEAMRTSFLRHLRAENKAPRTIQTYDEAVGQLSAFLVAHKFPTDVAKIKKEHIESYVGGLVQIWKPSTAQNRFKSLQQFFKWLEDEDEIHPNPMGRMKPPQIPDTAARTRAWN